MFIFSKHKSTRVAERHAARPTKEVQVHEGCQTGLLGSGRGSRGMSSKSDHTPTKRCTLETVSFVARRLVEVGWEGRPVGDVVSSGSSFKGVFVWKVGGCGCKGAKRGRSSCKDFNASQANGSGNSEENLRSWASGTVVVVLWTGDHRSRTSASEEERDTIRAGREKRVANFRFSEVACP